MKEKIKVLIIDDSTLFRQVLGKILSDDPGIEVMATAADPYIAAEKMKIQAPDVITLDITMPRMDGITFLKKIMSQHPIPVVIISDAADIIVNGPIKTLLDLGAVEVLSKDIFDVNNITDDIKTKICNTIKSAIHFKLKRKSIANTIFVHPKLSADVVLQQAKLKNLVLTNDRIIAVGASTGGTEAIRIFLQALPPDAPGIVIVQHMPENFTRSFAERLNELCAISVKEAENGDLVLPGRALLAPGNYHLLLKKRGTKYYVETNNGPLVNRHRPAVDVLFRSVAMYAGKSSIGILLTGMGYDGAKGLLEIKEAGGETIAQDEDSSVVFGMPKEAIRLNGVNRVLPVAEIAKHVMQLVSRSKSFKQ